MKFSHDGLTLWYGTEDAPGPVFTGNREPISITIGVYPASPNNRVMVNYRVDGGPIRVLSAFLIESDPIQKIQYFRTSWPNSLRAEKVEYHVILTCAGRQVPEIENANKYFSSFIVSQPELNHANKLARDLDTTTAQPMQLSRHSTSLDFLGTVNVQLSKPPEIIGETPEGLKVNWFLQGGEVSGPKLNASICPNGGDWMTIRPDGIGLLGIRATLKTAEGALIYTTYSGVLELGEDGYRNFLNQKWPQVPQLRSTPRFLTTHAQYQWLNRLQCVGIGEVRMSELVVIYDLYAL